MPAVLFVPISSVVPPVPTTTAPQSRQDYWRALADELGFWHKTLTTATPSVGESSRVVLANEWRDDESDDGGFGQFYLYLSDGAQAGTQRRVLSTGYHGAQSAVRVNRPYLGSIVSGTTVEITAPLPVVRYMGIKGLADCVNEALARLWLEVRITFTGNGTQVYSLDAYPWVVDAQTQVRGLYDRVTAVVLTTLENPVLSPYGARIRRSGGSFVLETDWTYTAADTFYLATLVRADTYFSPLGAGFAYQATRGLTNDADIGAAPLRHVVTIGMVKALQQLAKMATMDRRLGPEARRDLLANISARRQDWAKAARRIVEAEMVQPAPHRSESMLSIGGAAYGPYGYP